MEYNSIMKIFPIEIVSNDDKAIVLSRICPFCGKAWQIQVNSKLYYNGMRKYNAGSVVQNAFPLFTQSQREFIITGICDECWENI